MNALTPLVFEESLVRTVMREGGPWFVGKDVCQVLDISKHHQALDRLDADERGTYNVGTPGGEQTVIIVSEAGVYRLIFTSRKPSAERFKRWLAHDVLPALRRTGEFRTSEGPSHVHNPFEITAEAIPVLQTKLQMVREARHLHGHERARQLWAQLQLPSVAVNPHSGRSEAYDLLQYILDGKCMGQTLRGLLDAALEGDKGRADTLKRAGIVAEPGRDGFIVANQHPHLETILEGTEWAKGKWQWVLRRLPGAHPVPPRLWMKGVNARGLFLPCGLLDFGEHSIDRDFAPAADGT